MFVRCKKRFKDGKEHRYWSVVESTRVEWGWIGIASFSISARSTTASAPSGAARSRFSAAARRCSFPEDRPAPVLDCDVVQESKKLNCAIRAVGRLLAGAGVVRLGLDRILGPAAAAQPQGHPMARKSSRCRSVIRLAAAPATGMNTARYVTCWAVTLRRQALLLLVPQGALERFEARFDVLLYADQHLFRVGPALGGQTQFGYSRDKRPDQSRW